MQNNRTLENLIERYDSGENIVRAIFNFGPNGEQSNREYRLFAERCTVQNSEVVSAKKFTVNIDARVTISCGESDIKLWQRISIPGVFEGETAHDALEHALQSLNARAVGQSHDDEITDLKVVVKA
jgi:hypothetical protein